MKNKLFLSIMIILSYTITTAYSQLADTVWTYTFDESISKIHPVMTRNGTSIYVSAQGGDIYLIDAMTGKAITLDIEGIHHPQLSKSVEPAGIALSEDETKIFIAQVDHFKGEIDNKIISRFLIIDRPNKKIIHDEIFETDKYGFISLAYSPLYHKIYIASEIPNQDYVWYPIYKKIVEIDEYKLSNRQIHRIDRVKWLDISPDGKVLVTRNYNNTIGREKDYITVYDAGTMEKLPENNVTFYKGTLWDVTFTTDSQFLFASGTGYLAKWRLPDMELIFLEKIEDIIPGYFNLALMEFSHNQSNKGIFSLAYGTKYEEFWVDAVYNLFKPGTPITSEILSEATKSFYIISPDDKYYYTYVQDKHRLEKRRVDFDSYTDVFINELERSSSVYPNPSHDEVSLEFFLQKAHQATAEVLNAEGIIVKTINLGFLDAGEQLVNLSTRNLPAGVYFVKVESGKSVFVHKFVTIK